MDEGRGGLTEEARGSRDGQSDGQGGGASLDLRGLIQYRWELTLGEQTLTREEFERLAELGSPLVRLGEEWLELDPVQVQAARQFMDRNSSAGKYAAAAGCGTGTGVFAY